MQASRLGRSAAPQLERVGTNQPRLMKLVAWLTREPVWVVTWFVAGMAARLWSFGWFPLREDEAIYAYWARLVSSGLDPMLERVAVDKPPFFIYTLARFFTWFGPTLTAGRWLNELCSLASILLLWVLARRVYGPVTARIALALFALSPFAISFASTLYTDPMLTAWLLLALVLAAYGWGLPAGLATGMAFATKQNAVLFVPLVVGVMVVCQASGVRRQVARVKSQVPGVRCQESGVRGQGSGVRGLRLATNMALFGLGFYFIWYKVWQWDGWRILPAEIPSFWQQAWNTYGGVHLAPVAEWPGRLAAWAEVWRWLGGWTAGALALVGLAAAGAAFDIKHRRSGWGFSALVAAFVAAYAVLHALFTFQPWDRYLLPLAPLLALLAARGGEGAWTWTANWSWRRPAMALVLTALLVGGAVQASLARNPVGGDRGAYAGIETVAAYLQEQVPPRRGVLYHRWLGWHWNWYLWDGPKGRVYWSEPDMVVADLRKDPFGYDRYIVFPGWQEAERPALEAALAPFDIALVPQLIVLRPDGGVQFTVYRFRREGAS